MTNKEKPLIERIDECLSAYKCKYHQYQSFENPHGCTDCLNTGYVFEDEESFLLAESTNVIVDSQIEIERLKEENEELKSKNKKLIEMGKFYAENTNWYWDTDSCCRYCITIIDEDVEMIGSINFGGKLARETLRGLDEN